MKTKIMVSGVNGFLGRNLVKHFTQTQFDVVPVSARSGGEKALRAFLESQDASIVVHCAAAYDTDCKEEQVFANILMPTLFGEYLSEQSNKKLMISFGSFWQLYNAGEKSFYACTKKAVNPLLEYYDSLIDMRCWQLLLYGTYGEGDTRGKLIDYLIMSAKRNSVAMLNNPDQLVNLTHVSDLCSSITNLILNSQDYPNHVYSLKHALSVKVSEVVEMIQSCGVDIKVSYRHKTEAVDEPDDENERICLEPQVELRDFIERQLS